MVNRLSLIIPQLVDRRFCRMRKTLIFCFAFFILLTTGCHNQPDSSAPISDIPPIVSDPVIPSTADFRIQTGAVLLPNGMNISYPELYEGSYQLFHGFERPFVDFNQFILDYDGNYLYSRKDSATGTQTFYEFGAKGITEIIQATNIGLGSGDIIVTEDMTLLYSGTTGDDESQSSLIKVDLINRTEEALLTFTGWPPFQYMHLIDNNTLLVFRPIRIEDAETEKFCYNIERYALDSKTKTLLVQVPDSTKGFITCYDYVDGVIYAYQGDISDDGTAHYYIQAYDTAGKPLHRYNVDDLRNNFAMPQEGEHVLQMTVFKDYFLFKTNMDIYYLLKADAEHSLNFVDLPNNGDRYLSYYPAARLTGRFGIFYDRETDVLYRYNTEDECFVQQQVRFDLRMGEHYTINLIREKNDGSLIVNIRDDKLTDCYMILPPL